MQITFFRIETFPTSSAVLDSELVKALLELSQWIRFCQRVGHSAGKSEQSSYLFRTLLLSVMRQPLMDVSASLVWLVIHVTSCAMHWMRSVRKKKMLTFNGEMRYCMGMHSYCRISSRHLRSRRECFLRITFYTCHGSETSFIRRQKWERNGYNYYYNPFFSTKGRLLNGWPRGRSKHRQDESLKSTLISVDAVGINTMVTTRWKVISTLCKHMGGTKIFKMPYEQCCRQLFLSIVYQEESERNIYMTSWLLSKTVSVQVAK